MLFPLMSQARVKVGELVGRMKRSSCDLATKLGACLRMTRPYQKTFLISAGIGMACAVAGYFAGPWIAAGTAWVAGFATTLGVQAGLAYRRMISIGDWA